MITEECCQAQKWLCGHVFVMKNTFILKIFDFPVVLLQANVCASDYCEKTWISLFKQKSNIIVSEKFMVTPYFHFTFR